MRNNFLSWRNNDDKLFIKVVYHMIQIINYGSAADHFNQNSSSLS